MDDEHPEIEVETPSPEERPDTPVSPDDRVGLAAEGRDGRGIEIGNIDSEAAHIVSAGQIDQINQIDNHYVFGLDQQTGGWIEGFLQAPLKASHFDEYSWEQIHEQARKIEIDKTEVDRLTTRLRKERLLLVEGAADVGKTALILVVASALFNDAKVEKVLLSREAPPRPQKVELLDLAGGAAEFRHAIVVLRDAFHHQNEFLQRFARQGGSLQLTGLSDRLDEHGSFLILTWDTDHRPPLHGELAQRVQTVEGPPAKAVAEFLKNRSREMISARLRGEEKDQLLARFEELFEQTGRAMLDRLRLIGRVERFIQHHLLEVLRAADLGAALDQALERVDQHDLWLLEDVGRDTEALACALALAVGHTGPPGFPLRWHVFHKLRGEILRVLRRELGERGTRATEALCHEPELLRRMDAEVLMIDSDGPVVRWREERRAERLWASLLGTGRSLLALLVPRLTQLCQEGDFAVRRHAAWALAKIGQLDPQGIPLWLIGRWLDSSDQPGRHAALGALLQGAAIQSDENLKRSCLLRLSQALKIPGHGKEKRAGVLACGDVGVVDLGWALGELREVARCDLLPRLQKLQTLDRTRRQAEVIVRRQTGSHALQSELDRQLDQELKKILAQLFPPGGVFELFAGCQYVLVGLAFCHGPLRVFDELGTWMPDGRETEELAPLLALMFFRVGGVLDVLERYPTSRDPAGQSMVSRIVLSASDDDAGARKLASTWFKLFLGSRWFPPGIARGLALRLWRWLIETSRQEAEGDFRPFIVDHWRQLLRSPNVELRQQLGDLLVSPELEVRRSTATLASEIRQGA